MNLISICTTVLLALCIPASLAKKSLVRHLDGDYFVSNGAGADECKCQVKDSVASTGGESHCYCRCPPHLPLLRDDDLICTDTVPECLLAEFVSKDGAEKVPYVFLPSQGQLLHPSAEVALLGLKTPGGELVAPVCVVTGARRLTSYGWQTLANTSNFEPPFRLHRQQGRTYLRWVGDKEIHSELEGRLVLVSLLCRDTVHQQVPHFSPCVAFRAAGSVNAPPVAVNEDDSNLRPWLIGGTVLGIAVLVYFSVVVWLLHRRNAARAKAILNNSESGNSDLKTICAKRYCVRKTSKNTASKTSIANHSGVPCETEAKKEEEEIKEDVDNDEIEDLTCRTANDRRLGNLKMNEEAQVLDESIPEVDQNPQETVLLSPTVSSFKSFTADDNIVGGNTETATSFASTNDVVNYEMENPARRKLYFNPSYFDPEFLHEPPPAALDFLEKIREIINSAKNKMKNRAFQPSLNDIPEDDYTYYSQSRPQSRSTAPATPRNRYNSQSSENPTLQYVNAIIGSHRECFQSVESNVDSTGEESDAASGASTLKRIAKRVNERGSSFVSEIIRTLDKKSKDSFAFKSNSSKAIPNWDSRSRINELIQIHTESSRTDHAANQNKTEMICHSAMKANSEDIVKPSVLKSLMKVDKLPSNDSNKTFDNFCQEMIATFSRLKNSEHSKSKNTSFEEETRDRTQRHHEVSSNENRKVMNWLQGLDSSGLYLNKNEDCDSLGEQAVNYDADPIHVPAIVDSKNKSKQAVLNKLKIEQVNNEFITVDETYEEIKNDSNLIKNDTTPFAHEFRSADKHVKAKRSSAHRRVNLINNSFDNSDTDDNDDSINMFDPDTFERPQKRRQSKLRTTEEEKSSDYCTSGSDEVHDARSGQSLRSSISGSSDGSQDLKTRSSNRTEYNTNSADSYDARSSSQEGKPRLPPKCFNLPKTEEIPIRPPKHSPTNLPGDLDRPALPVKEHRIKNVITAVHDKPEIPKKVNKMNSLNKRISVPSLSKEAAATILLGLQASSSFLTCDSESGNEMKENESLSSFSSSPNLVNDENKSANSGAKNHVPVSECKQTSEERVRGQFILAPEGQSQHLRRNSLTNSRRCSSKCSSVSKDVKLCRCAKTELEEHFIKKGKSDAESIKKSWQQILKKSDFVVSIANKSCSEISTNDSSQSVEAKARSPKSKQDDSGYQSSDSFETTETRGNSFRSVDHDQQSKVGRAKSKANLSVKHKTFVENNNAHVTTGKKVGFSANSNTETKKNDKYLHR